MAKTLSSPVEGGRTRSSSGLKHGVSKASTPHLDTFPVSCFIPVSFDRQVPLSLPDAMYVSMLNSIPVLALPGSLPWLPLTGEYSDVTICGVAEEMDSTLHHGRCH